MAERAGTAQSVVARVEAGITDPSSETLNRLVAAAGFAIRCVSENEARRVAPLSSRRGGRARISRPP